MLTLKDIPDSKGNRYPEPITIRVSSSTKKILDRLKDQENKDTAELVRLLIDKFIQENNLDQAG